METGNTALHEAAARGDKDAVRALLGDSANLYIRNKSGATALHLACQFGRSTCARLLLEAGCRTNVTDTYDDTPLHTAVRYLHVGVTKTLLVYNADPNERNKNDDTPLHLSCNLGHRKLSKMLLQAGASRKMINCQGESAIDIAARKQSDELVTLLRTAPSTSHNKDSIKRWGKDRRNLIRMRLQAAREAGSNWHLLFQDFDPIAQAGHSSTNSKTGLPIIKKGEQFFIDLSGKIHKGNCKDKDKSALNCYCAPFFSKLVKQSTTAHQELLDEIDACHDELSHEISDLRQVTERKLADLHRDLRQFRPRQRRQTRGDSSSPAAGRLIRSKSESEIEPDHLSPDCHSNASDDIYIERYFRPQPKLQPSKSGASRDKRSADSSRLSSDTHTTASHLSKIQTKCQETMRQFNCLDLDDTCTTPTSASSHRTSRSSRRLTGDAFSLASTDKHTEAVYAADTSHRASIYSSRSGDAGPQPPSLDSGYGTGFSPSPARPSMGADPWTVQSPSMRSIEMATQTDQLDADANEYTELESAVVLRPCVAVVKRPLPRLPIPPPPTKPLPPLPKPRPSSSSNRKPSDRTRIYCVSTNV